MTYVPLQVFTECMRVSGIESAYEYEELHKRGIVPTKLMPKVPSIFYKSHGIYVKRGTHIKTFEKMYGRKYNPKNKEDHRLLKIITHATPKAVAGKAEWGRKPEVKARKKEYMKLRQQTPEFKARTKTYRQTSEYKAKKKVYSAAYYKRPEIKARASAYSKEYLQRPEVKERRRLYDIAYKQRHKQ